MLCRAIFNLPSRHSRRASRWRVRSGNIMFAVASLSNLGGLYLLQGHLKLAEAVYHQALELATTPYGQRLPVACRALLGLSEIAREWNDLEQARQLLEEALQLSQQYNETGELVMYLSLARVLQAQGDGEKALDLVQKAQAIAIQSTGSTIDDRLVDVALARLWLQQGNISGAAEWAARRGFEQDLSSEALPGGDAQPHPVRFARSGMDGVRAPSAGAESGGGCSEYARSAIDRGAKTGPRPASSRDPGSDGTRLPGDRRHGPRRGFPGKIAKAG